MDIVEYYFAFHRPATFREIRAGASYTSLLGHVEAFGYTMDETWFFFDPGRSIANLKITHMHDEVNDLLAARFTATTEVYRYAGNLHAFPAPLHGPMNCVTQCASLIGLRAFTPQGFRKKLIAHKAELIHGPEKQRRSGRS